MKHLLVFFLFEIKYRLQRPATYIYFGIIFLIGVFYGSMMNGSFGTEITVLLTGGGQNIANSPINIATITSALTQLSIFFIAGIMGVPIYRDFEHNTYPLFFTKPINKGHYLFGRFLGSYLVTLLVLSGITFGLLTSLIMPKVDHDSLGAFSLITYLKPYLLTVIPYSFLTGTLFFTTVSLSRNQLFIYLNAIIILVLFNVATALTIEIENATIASLLDPSGDIAIQKHVEYWTVAERNSLQVPFVGNIAWNRLIWVLIPALILVLTYFKFSFSMTGKLKLIKQRAGSILKLIADTVTIHRVDLPQVSKDFTRANHFKLFLNLTKRELSGILKNIIFLSIIGVGLIWFVVATLLSGQFFETSTYPVTYQILGAIQNNFPIFLVAITIFYSGELVWSERDKKVNNIYDSFPVPTWVTFTSKVVTLFGLQFFVLAVIMVVGMLIQTFQGYFNYEIGLYFKTLFLLRSVNYLLFCVLAVFIQTVTNHKYLGFFVTILAYLLSSTFLPLLGLQHNLWSYSSDPGLPYSDMNGYGHFVWGFLTFKAYWISLALILLVVTNLFWVRGSETDLLVRISLFKQRLTTRAKSFMLLFAAAFVGLGGYIFYNTNILNQYITSEERQQQTADFEKAYKKYDGIAQPKITSVTLEIDLYPKDRNMKTKGIFTLKNKSEQPIDSIHLNLNGSIDYHEISFSRTHKNVLFDSVGYYAIYEFDPPIQQGDSLELRFDLSYLTKGFTHGVGNTSIVENGTFFNSWIYPQIGYQPNVELRQQDLREEYDLPPRNRVPRIDDTVAVMNNFISNDADWIDFKAIVSTSEDQIAVVPGYLMTEKTENGRRYFEYAMDSKMLNFYSVLSAQYELLEDHWISSDGDSVKLEIYYHDGHEYNLDNMMNSMKKSLDYFTVNFGPYQHRQVRILEFPRYAAFAQSFANTVPFSEAIGFIANVEDEDVNYPFYVTSHEVAHQWWAHQVIGGNVQGSQFLSETMSQYGALMVMEKEFGDEHMRDYLKQEMNSYLQARSAESREEMPALLSEGQQYIHYNKGSIIMYALKDYIGEENLNSAIREYLNKVKFQKAPYTTTLEFFDHVKRYTPDSLRYVLTDLFETITLYENKVKEGHFTMIDSSNYEVTFTIDAAKFVADGYGNEDSVALNDYIDIGIFTREKVDGDWQEKVLYLEKKKITDKTMTFTISVPEEPRNVGIDPYNKLIDRKPDDNIFRISEKEDE